MSNTEVMSMSFEPGAVAAPDVIPLCVPELRGNEWKYVKECLDTNWVSSAGPFVDRFEQAVAGYAGVKHAVAAVNGTCALHIALIVAGVEPNDEVILPTLTFIAPANAVRYAQAWPVFMDVEPEHWQLDVNKLKEFLQNECTWRDRRLVNKTSGRRVRAILPVHILGHPNQLGELFEISRQYELPLVEDATESLGARYKDRAVGCYVDIGCYSFNGNKIITTGGGGIIVTNNPSWAERAKYLTTQAKDDPIEYVHSEVGYNYRLPNMQAAVGVAQMELLDEFVGIKRRNAAEYRKLLGDVPGLTFMKEAPWAQSAYWLCTVLVDSEKFGMDRRQLLSHFQRESIQTRPLWQPLHRSRAHAASQSYRIEVADRIHHAALSLPSSVGLKNSDLEKVVQVLKSATR